MRRGVASAVDAIGLKRPPARPSAAPPTHLSPVTRRSHSHSPHSAPENLNVVGRGQTPATSLRVKPHGTRDVTAGGRSLSASSARRAAHIVPPPLPTTLFMSRSNLPQQGLQRSESVPRFLCEFRVFFHPPHPG